MEEEKKKINKSDRISATKVASIKVTNMVGTFLNRDSSVAMISQYQPIKVASEKVTNTVGTFLNGDSGVAMVS